MVMVDVSGFTSMSERLARHGKVGAEEVTEVIGSTFERLLAEAYAFGATLVKFGGDALLLFFRGEGHPQRACAAAHEMRHALRDIGVFKTTAGQVRLRMSVGVHTGSFDFFMVGDSHRELLIAGPAATATIMAEKIAGAGQIVITPATAAELPKRAIGKSVDAGFLLAGHVAAPTVDIDVAQPNPLLTQFVPLALREPLLAGQVEPEHRPAVVTFLSFTDFDRLILGDGPEAAALALDRLVRTVQTAVDRHSVTFLASDAAGDGGKIILTSGVPQTTGFDAEEMLLAAYDIANSALDVPVHIGVNWGPVFAGEVGPAYRRTYTVMGDTVNLAARLMAQAGPGEVLATRDVLGLSRTLFLTERREPFYVKGKQHPVSALEVGAPCGTRQAADAGIPLIGRDEELQVLEGAWRSAEAAEGRLVELVAEPGMGKSRLLQEFLIRIDDAPLVTAECRLYQAGTPFFPIKSLLGTVLGTEGMKPIAAEALLRDTVARAAPELKPWLALIGVVLDLEIEESRRGIPARRPVSADPHRFGHRLADSCPGAGPNLVRNRGRPLDG